MPESGCATVENGERDRKVSLGAHQAQEHGYTEYLRPTFVGVGGTTSGERGYQVETRGERHSRPWPEAEEGKMSDTSSSLGEK